MHAVLHAQREFTNLEAMLRAGMTSVEVDRAAQFVHRAFRSWSLNRRNSSEPYARKAIVQYLDEFTRATSGGDHR